MTAFDWVVYFTCSFKENGQFKKKKRTQNDKGVEKHQFMLCAHMLH